jgi:hypothetical protein
MGKRARQPPSDDPSFLKDLSEWMDSPEGEQYMEVSETLAELLDNVQLDAQHRQFIWPNGKRLNLEQSVRYIRKQHPSFPAQTIADALISWVEQGYVPKNLSQDELAELERLTGEWADDYERQREARRERE